MQINFKLFVHKGQTRPFNYTHELEHPAYVEMAEFITGHGYDFHLHINPRTEDKVLLAIARPDGEHLVTASIADIDADTLNAVLPGFLHHGLSLTHYDLKHLGDSTRLVAYFPFTPHDTEGRD